MVISDAKIFLSFPRRSVGMREKKLIDFRFLKMKRYRAIYQIDNRNKTIIIYAIGHRRDIYEVITELVR